ncbi:SDR family oxidoreductase [Denitratisoma oestradiolicum]|uniref:Short-chain dehydrogenase n=1 Tax=Denitratisoma oestradiolicum TaxID=311182 RepID=A0A6S6XXC0_9PROT|nr:SDR family oxidoreductase [Denitratisoma oestradiolicum]TWO81686.1 short-chain dehydrogenase [Denitratisoma oestradiolicum]CAB1370634.1 Short-chain dehydrogenase [Denitratisoma oestradiolicum]
MLLKNKVIIVSGIGPGLGVKLAIEAAREGAKVAISARTAANLDDAEQRMRAIAPDCEVLKQTNDITDREQCKRLVEATVARFGRIDGLINSAVFHGNFEGVENADLEDWRRVFDTNVIGTMNLTQETIQAMKKSGGGAIAMVNTMATRKPFPSEAGYAASKGALTVAAKYLAKEVGRYNIRVNSVYPGWMWGLPVQGYAKNAAAANNITEEQAMAPIVANIPLGRIVTDDEVARVALFLVSDYSTAMTGAILDANGGEFIAV